MSRGSPLRYLMLGGVVGGGGMGANNISAELHERRHHQYAWQPGGGDADEEEAPHPYGDHLALALAQREQPRGHAHGGGGGGDALGKNAGWAEAHAVLDRLEREAVVDLQLELSSL